MNEDRHGFFDQEMELLENYIGKRVKCVYIVRGEKSLLGHIGTLNSVIPYDTLSVGTEALAFLNEFVTVVAIGDENGNLIYKNDKIPINEFLASYPRYFWEDMLLMSDQEKYLGYSVKKEDMLSRK